ncbi:MAG: hypothetical protein JF616_18010 [Fibrobacteres bacterium]|nr:hypothetical protein [Fibrobacterota bacterium]
MRLIEEFANFVGKIMSRIQRGEIKEARKEIEIFYRDTLSHDAGLMLTFSDRDLIARLSKDGVFDAVKGLNLAKVLLIDAGLAERSEAGQADGNPIARVKYSLAFGLMAEAAAADPEDFPDWAETDLAGLATKLSDWQLPPDLLRKLFRYEESKGRYGKAEDALFRLKASGFPGIEQEGRMFYARMDALSDAQLMQGNLPREELEDGKERFR